MKTLTKEQYNKAKPLLPINCTHIAKHTDPHNAKKILSIVRNRGIKILLKYGYSKVTKFDGHIYYSKVRTSFVDIKESIALVEEIQENPYWRVKEYDYQESLDVLRLVLADRIKYENKVPDTTDTYREHYHAVPQHTWNYENRVKRVACKRVREKKFSVKFSEAKIIWS